MGDFRFVDAYEYTMAKANFENKVNGKKCIFNAALRNMPTNKIVGHFAMNGVEYPKLDERKFMINAGLEKVIEAIIFDRNNKINFLAENYQHSDIKDYLKKIFNWDEEEGFDNFMDGLITPFKFNGDIYGMEEGVPFFGHQPLIKVMGDFETCQLFESIILSLLNRQVNVATSAYDIYQASNQKILLEGGSRRSFGAQDSVNLSRAAIIGGFTASSNVKFGMEYNKAVGGTHGHSYILLYGDEYEAFKAQSKTHGDKSIFLLDTYDVENAFEIALKVAKEDGRKHFGFRIDSGDLLEQAKWIHQRMKEEGYKREQYTIFASDDLTAGKIQQLEENGADIDKYLIGTYLSMQPKNPGIVYKLTAKEENGEWVPTAKKASDPGKATIGGNIQIYRIEGESGFYKRDYIASEEENINGYLEKGESAHPLLKKIVENGEIVYKFPTLDQIKEKRESEMFKFKDIDNYPVVLTEKIKETKNNE